MGQKSSSHPRRRAAEPEVQSIADISRKRVLPPPKRLKSRAAIRGYYAGQKLASDVSRQLRREQRGPYAPDAERGPRPTRSPKRGGGKR